MTRYVSRFTGQRYEGTTAEELVGLMCVMNGGQDVDSWMREMAAAAVETTGRVVRSTSPQEFLHDMTEIGLFTEEKEDGI